MTYPNMDLQSLPASMELRVGTDPVERTLQLAYYQFFAALLALKAVSDGSQYPEKVSDEGSTAMTNFDTYVTNLLTDMTATEVHWAEIWAIGA